MSKSHWLVAAVICTFIATPTISNAQAADSTKNRLKEDPEDFVHDVLRSILGPHWNMFVHGGFTTTDRFLLQQAVNPINGQRALQSSTGFNIGGGAGVDVLLRLGFRASYTFTSNTLNFDTDNGDGSKALTIGHIGTVMTHTATVEVMRYMLPTRAAITPYGTLGLKGMWWVLHEKSPMLTSNGATPFSVGPLASFGVQFKGNDKWSGRFEATVASGDNPFSGNKSFRALAGQTIDEPTGVSHTDYRFALVYNFGRTKVPTASAPVAHK